MRNFLYTCIVTLILTGNLACKKFTNFKFSLNTETTLPANSPLNLPFDVFSPKVTTNTESTFEANDTRSNLVDKINLSKCIAKITNPTTRNFDFLSEVHVYISAAGIGETEIAYATNIDDNIGNELSLTSTGVNLKDYLSASEITIRINAVSDKITGSDTDMDILTEFAVKAKLAK